MTKLPTSLQIDKAVKFTSWNLANKTLYDLCKRNFEHDSDEKILAKVWLIGRAYSVAIERRKNKIDINENFYTKTVAPKFKKSKLDVYLNELRVNKSLTELNLKEVLKVHHYLTKLISNKNFTAQNKRSFSSKYLHFHLPDLFFIYDSRAVSAIRKFIKGRVSKNLIHFTKSKNVDVDYAKFFCKCFVLKIAIEQEFKIKLTNRQLDNLLLEFANKKLSGKA